ncbi:Inner membrane lipoprotein YiaD precursor [Salinivirga cyanobacteriivorans]|uniref:Inner membrane lipoprotein YiaD n=2 Tax=Salinivirga cyanobacteriivorans TaxID=1307839 RepID=A0A0S2I145_9BACT|nr:Inner membrane lipoprotein YiaD precursor [Salinivirga cyanobacteriivorans]
MHIKPLSMKKVTIPLKFFIVSLIAFAVVQSCVPAKQLKELQYKHNRAVVDRDSLKEVNEDLTVENTEMEAELELLRNQISGTRQQLANEIDTSRHYKHQYKVYQNMYEDLAKKQDVLIKSNQEETRKLMAELQVAREDLQQRQDRLYELRDSLSREREKLNMLQAQLDERNSILAALDSSLQEKEQKLQSKSKRINELERILQAKDSAVMALKNKVLDALLGFRNQGLTVTQKNGKVYVSLEEKLLFKSGQWAVDPKGKEALKKLAGVLASNEDVNIMIEGHTDDVPYNGSGQIKDNWDLSVKRATSILKILLENGNIDPQRLIAAGRGEHMPVDERNTREARRKNRRTEIILTPNLNELFEILETH